jgi:hypothetical protein
LLGTGVVAVAVRVRGRRRGKSWLLEGVGVEREWRVG